MNYPFCAVVYCTLCSRENEYVYVLFVACFNCIVFFDVKYTKCVYLYAIVMRLFFY